MRRRAFFVGFYFMHCLVSGQTPREFSFPEMGTTFRLVVYASDTLMAQKAADSCRQRAAALNLTMSDYRSDSELMRLCTNAQPDMWYAVSPDLFAVMAEAQRAARLTNGRFDVTISPLTKLWRRTRRQGQLPTPEDIAHARKSIGYQFIKLRKRQRQIKFLKPNMRLDLGGIGKGYALDQLASVLQTFGIDNVLLEAGGSVLALGNPPGQTGWKIAIQDENYFLNNVGISTSGDRFQFVEINGQRYAHILDPQTGFGFNEPREVTVVARNATIADWASTALYLMTDSERKTLLRKCRKDIHFCKIQ